MKYVMVVDKAVDLIGTDKWPKGGSIACSDASREMPLIFPDEFTHAVVFEKLRESYPGLVAISAGSCGLTEDGWFTEGKSISLQLESFPSDAHTIGDGVFQSVEDNG